ncbi:hypothetical protein [Tabrizicola sp.]|jgi:hypothetical protein|uniref:hypothetical protein n=1 Tax=Tabrizicola sp. TaxID=2005166 RepID=UPI003D2E7A76
MKPLTILAVLSLAQVAVAGAAFAQGCSGEKIKMSCAEGMTWDDKNHTCTPKPSA